ncbi:hypothetical protein RJT34_33226 [Clitoria ternatea]|uniref:Uncharacterized protein n=1 Tax=Clitoria ternatea TaxID=43366 RepID=A0AAN9EXG2_CLITE
MLVTGGVCLARVLTDPFAPPSFGAWIRLVRGPGGRFRNPYDHGIKKNCSDFMINGMKMWNVIKSQLEGDNKYHAEQYGLVALKKKQQRPMTLQQSNSGD